jgi:hypothetical protein
MNEHTVTKGQSLWEIARLHFGDPLRWPEIAKLNGLPDGNLIYVGQKLALPSVGRVSHAPNRILSNYSETAGMCYAESSKRRLGGGRGDQVFTRDHGLWRRVQGQFTDLRTVLEDQNSDHTLKRTALEVAQPICGISLDKSSNLFKPIVFANGGTTITLELTGSATLSTEGLANCEFNQDGISATIESFVQLGFQELVPGYQVSFDVNHEDITAATLSLTVVFKNKAGATSEFKCSLKPYLPLLIFEASPAPMVFEVGNNRLEGNIGLKVTVTKRPPLPHAIQDNVTEQVKNPTTVPWLEIGLGIGTVVVVAIAVKTAPIWIPASGLTAAVTATAKAASTAFAYGKAQTVSFATALVLFASADEVERERHVEVKPDR